MIVHWIWLTGLPRLGPVRQRKLLEQFGSAEAVYAADEAALRRAGLSEAAVQAVLRRDLTGAERILQACEAGGIRVLTWKDSDYPEPLRAAEDAPLVLYLRGSLPDLGKRPCVGLVGAREADERGLALARQLGWQIAGCGGIVVTGMARGVDAWAASGALDFGGPVVGVLGCGADVVYPKEEAALFAQTVAQGCVISEYPPGTAPNAKHFPARNRIISALSDAVAVVQAAEQSGALITARCAADQGRDVFAVPGPAGDPRSRGCSQLLRQGALLAECGWDIVSEYEYRYPGSVREYHGRPWVRRDRGPGPSSPSVPAGALSAGTAPAAAAPGPAAGANQPPVRPQVRTEGLSEIQLRIVQTLQAGPLQLDALIDRLGLPAARILPELTLLQIRGVLRQKPGRVFELAD